MTAFTMGRFGARSITISISVSIMLWAAGPTEAQQAANPRRIGVLSYLGCEKSLAPGGAFRQGLTNLGYVEGQNLILDCRDAPGEVERLGDLAIELLRLKVEVLVAEATPASLAAQRASTTTPIVILSVADPVASGLVASLARPGRNITGVSLFPVLGVVPKVLELLKEVAPRISRTAVLMDRSNSAQVLTDGRVDEVGRALGIQPLRFDVRRTGDVQSALTAAVAQQSQALFVYPLPVGSSDIQRIAQFALTKRLPAVTFWEGYVEQGFLIFYGTGIEDQRSRATVYVDKILKGARPADLPVEQPTKLQMVVNLRTARALRITIPSSVVVRADRLIE